MTKFELDPRLAADTEDVGTLGLCRVMLMNDARYPWLILVPQQAGLIELGDLNRDDRICLMDEIEAASAALTRLYTPEKINTGALGNIVRQLHIHIVARNTGDPAWPGPVWGHSPALPYADDALKARVAQIRGALDINPA
jgi:diadenosine tetraphosphate (Ap4A) HIT family hydrolase